VFVAALIPLGRYSVPILPCLSILAAFGVDTLLNKFRVASEFTQRRRHAMAL
jgi:hypothetical protein